MIMVVVVVRTMATMMTMTDVGVDDNDGIKE
jgi:hypothetical protein